MFNLLDNASVKAIHRIAHCKVVKITCKRYERILQYIAKRVQR